MVDKCAPGITYDNIIQTCLSKNDLVNLTNDYNTKYNDILEVFKLQIDYVEPKELIREVINIKKQRYNDYLKQKLKENQGQGI